MAPKFYQKTSVIQLNANLRKTQKPIGSAASNIICPSHDNVKFDIKPRLPTATLTYPQAPHNMKAPCAYDIKQDPFDPASDVQIIECPICGEQTKNNFHYGGVACDSCKAFFRRTAVCPSKKSQKCKTGIGKCLLKRERRNNCPYCRFKECLRNGMNPNLIKTKSPKLLEKLNQHVAFDSAGNIADNEMSVEDQLSQILEYHRLVLSQTFVINLMTVPDKFLNLINRNINLAKPDPDVNYDVLTMAEIEHSFLSVKSEFLNDSRTKIEMFPQGLSPSELMLKVQELVLELMMRLMRGCKYFESLSWDCKTRLLRKNITDISTFLLLMSYEKKSNLFRFNLTNSVVEVNQDKLSEYMPAYVAHDVFEVI